MHKKMLAAKRVLAACVVMAGAGGAAWAEGSGDALRGQAYAHAMCSSCHAIDASGAASSDPKATSFAVAKWDYTSGEALAAWINTKHPTFPASMLNPRQAEDIMAYVAGLGSPARK